MSLFEDNYIVLTTKNAIAVICLISQLAIVSIICAPATADYTGLNSVVTSDIDIDGIMYQSVDLYVGLTDPNDSIWAVISEDDSPLILSAPNGGLYQSPLGGSTPHDVALDDLFGDMLRYDSFVTIGSNSTEPCCTILLGFDVDAFDNNDEIVMDEGVWAVLPDNPMASLGAGSEHGVLIGRFTFRTDQSISGHLNFMGRLANGDNWSVTNASFAFGPQSTDIPDLDGHQDGEWFGRNIAILGDIDGDDIHDFAVGAPKRDNLNKNAGAVYVYSGKTRSLIRVLQSQRTNDNYGSSIANAGDIDGDEIPDLMVSAPAIKNTDFAGGRVDLVSGADGHTIQSLYSGETGDYFGTSIAGPPPGTSFSNHTLLVSAPYHKTGNKRKGRIYIFDRSGTLLSTIDGANSGDRFGHSVAFTGDINGDSVSDFIVGSPKNDDANSNAGRVDIYDGSSYDTITTLLGHKEKSRFGQTVAGAGYLDDDGYSDFVVGATHFGNSNGTKIGRVYAYSGKHKTELWHKTGKQAKDKLGSFLSITEDVNCNGYNDVLIGSPKHSSPELNESGQLLVCSGNNKSLITISTGTQAESRYGISACVLYGGDNTPTIYAGASHAVTTNQSATGCVFDIDLTECSATTQRLQQHGDSHFFTTGRDQPAKTNLSDNMKYYLGNILNLPIDRPVLSIHSR
ncbi:MAG: integrin alpha [Phycisphaerales bacterium]|nr:integrin alpha [Phycisphaerales bacterium]